MGVLECYNPHNAHLRAKRKWCWRSPFKWSPALYRPWAQKNVCSLFLLFLSVKKSYCYSEFMWFPLPTTARKEFFQANRPSGWGLWGFRIGRTQILETHCRYSTQKSTVYHNTINRKANICSASSHGFLVADLGYPRKMLIGVYIRADVPHINRPHLGSKINASTRILLFLQEALLAGVLHNFILSWLIHRKKITKHWPAVSSETLLSMALCPHKIQLLLANNLRQRHAFWNALFTYLVMPTSKNNL